MSYHSYNIGALGAVEDLGVPKYTISGNPVTALLAQLNRFAGKTVKPGTCGERRFLTTPFPLVATIDNRAAVTAIVIMWSRYSCVPPELSDRRREQKWGDAIGADAGTQWSLVMNNLTDLTTNIAQFADSLGLSAASVGITEVDQRVAPKFPVMTVALLGAAAIGAFVLVNRRKR